VANFIMQAVWSKAQEPAAAAPVRTRTQAIGIGQ
jgi:hypothetical protein